MSKHEKIESNVPVRSAAPLGVGLPRRIQALSGPALELKDKDGEYELIAEVPGMKPEDIEVKVSDGILRLSGEKKEKHEESKEGYIFSERRYGHFERAVELPKSAEAMQRERKIEISA